MNSTIEYIRKLNQASVTVQAEWLARLQNVDAGLEARVAVPEIVLTKETAAPKFTSDEITPPVTMVNSNAQGQGEPAQDLPGTHEAIVTSSIDALSALLQDNEGEPFFRSVTETASPEEWEYVGSDEIVNESVTTDSVATTSQEIQSPNNREIKAPELNAPLDKAPVKSPGLSRLNAELETPAVLADIVRPTIIPTHGNSVTDETVASGSDTDQAVVVDPVTPTENCGSDLPMASELEPLDTAVNLSVEPDDEEQLVQLLSDFGLAGGSSNDTLTREEMTELFPNLQTYEPVLDEDDALPLGKEMLQCVFPDDKRGEHFTYEQTKRQALVDSIVDQIFERFQPGHHATIMLVAANREIDVDSAASRIATCLAGRETGETILVDGNLASRQLTALLGATNQPGITDAFGNQSEIQSTICNTDRNELKFIPAGVFEISEDYSDLTATNEVNQKLKSRFDYTIVSGGIAGDPLSDAWSRVADGIYLIVDMDESDRAATVATVDYFRKLGARIVGCIATRA